MRGTRTIRGWALAACLGLLGACQTEQQRKEPSPRPRPDRALPSASGAGREGERSTPRPVPLPPAVAHTLESVHEYDLELPPPESEPQRLDFGLGRLAQATQNQVLFRETERGDLVTAATIGAVHALTHGSDGALFALGATHGVRLEPRAATAHSFPRTPFLPDARLYPVLEDPSHFDVYLPHTEQLLRFAFENEAGALAIMDAEFLLKGCLGAPALLRDGAFVCRTATGLLRQAPRGTRTQFRFASIAANPTRLLPANRLDELFSVGPAGEVLHLRLQAEILVLGRFQLPAPPFAAAVNRDALAFVLVSRPARNQPRRWTLLVTDFEGRPRFETELVGQRASADEDWLQTMLEDKNLALSWYQPLVAVGGGLKVSVWDYAAGRARFER